MPQIQQEDHVCIEIRQKLDRLLPSYECCIFRVHDELRQVNEKAYEPNIIAIGPYHHRNENLKMMEDHKLRYLGHHLQGNNEKLNRYVLALRALEQDARRCYVETPALDKDEWVKMLLLDGCFIIELVHKFKDKCFRETKDPIFKMDWVVKTLQCDLLLFENQLPFFVLCELFDMIEGKGREKNIPGDLKTLYKHLLGVVYDNWQPSFSEERCDRDVKFIHCVTELRGAGIKFKKSKESNGSESNLFNIKFEEGVLQIPLLTITDATESFLRNLIAYEQCCEGPRSHFVSDYAVFLDCLINSPNDVRVLCRNGIIDNWLGEDEEVSSMFNKLTKSVLWSGYLLCVNRYFESPEYEGADIANDISLLAQDPNRSLSGIITGLNHNSHNNRGPDRPARRSIHEHS
ncbi:hypothetical protein LguiA_029167 [Lonicera macranthoides]